MPSDTSHVSVRRRHPWENQIYLRESRMHLNMTQTHLRESRSYM